MQPLLKLFLLLTGIALGLAAPLGSRGATISSRNVPSNQDMLWPSDIEPAAPDPQTSKLTRRAKEDTLPAPKEAGGRTLGAPKIEEPPAVKGTLRHNPVPPPASRAKWSLFPASASASSVLPSTKRPKSAHGQPSPAAYPVFPEDVPPGSAFSTDVPLQLPAPPTRPTRNLGNPGPFEDPRSVSTPMKSAFDDWDEKKKTSYRFWRKLKQR